MDSAANVERDNLKTLIVASACGVAVFIALALSGVALVFRFDATNTARQNNARVWHAVVCNIEVVALKQKNLSTARRQYIINFYDGLLVNDVHSTGCGLEVKP